MQQALIERGVPADRIVRDFAGFSTLDSIVRARVVFGVDACCIITQREHALRAVYLARATGLDAIALTADDVANGRVGLKNRFRESLARVGTLLDIHLLGRKPRFLGPRIEIGPPPVSSGAS